MENRQKDGPMTSRIDVAVRVDQCFGFVFGENDKLVSVTVESASDFGPSWPKVGTYHNHSFFCIYLHVQNEPESVFGFMFGQCRFV